MPPAVVFRLLLVFDEQHPLFATYKVAKRIAIGIVGGSVLVLGVCMIVLPGPAFVVIPVGLGILGIEFAWARAWLKKIKAKAREMTRNLGSRAGNGKDAAARPPPRVPESRP
jgi:uncharacterized protein (TIGR02611 family)